MINKKIFFSLLLLAAGFLSAAAQKSPQDMDRFIDALMKKMTVEEKIGQLNLPVTGEITTGQAKSSNCHPQNFSSESVRHSIPEKNEEKR